MNHIVSNTPEMICLFQGIPGQCLLDTGSMVTLVSESFFVERLKPLGAKLSQAPWLKLTAANDIELPYVGYCEMDLEVCGQLIHNRGVLVAKGQLSGGKDGLIGMNVLRCVDNFAKLFQKEGLPQRRKVARIAGRLSVCIPAESVSTVKVKGLGSGLEPLIMEPLTAPLAGNVHLVRTVVLLVRGHCFCTDFEHGV